jgi:radical SAM superfamily enzyme YgiQ (UPF0313 family)
MKKQILEISDFEEYLAKNLSHNSKVLLINPPVEEVRYNWIRWNQPLDLLKLSSFLKSRGIRDVRLYDFMLPDRQGKVARRKIEDGREINGQRFTIWRFGAPWEDFKRKLRSLVEKEKWIPDIIIITSLTSYWVNSINELVNNHIRQWAELADSEINVCGNFSIFERENLDLLAGIDGAVVQKLDFRNHRSDLLAYNSLHGRLPSFAALDVTSDNLSEEVREAMRLGVTNFVFFNDDIFCEDSKIEILRQLKTSGNFGFQGLCGIWPHSLSVRRLSLLKTLGFRSLFMEYEVDKNGRLDLSAYERVSRYVRENPFIIETEMFGAFVYIGLPDDHMERIVYHTMVLNHFFESTILKPFGFSPEIDQRFGIQLPSTLKPQEKSAQVFPYQRFNGFSPEDYDNLYRWQGLRSGESVQKKALLFQPPIYDTQYYPEWSQPSGLLKVGAWLKKLGYETRLIDALFPDENRKVPRSLLKVVRICSTQEWTLQDYKKMRRSENGRLTEHDRYKFCFGRPLSDIEKDLEKLARGSYQLDLFGDKYAPEKYEPQEVWITSIMTYWWESTVDSVKMFKRVYPGVKVRIGGIYPTLAPEHLKNKLRGIGFDFKIIRGRDLIIEDGKVSDEDSIVTGEIPDASNEWLDFELYVKSQEKEKQKEEIPPYAILMTSRGCPFDCAYCAQRKYNEGNTQVRIRDFRDVYEEIEDKYLNYGIKQFCFYEDNFLFSRDNLKGLLELIRGNKEKLPYIRLFAPEGVEVRLLDQELASLMKGCGFQRIYLPLETTSSQMNKQWGRTHSDVSKFEAAVEICKKAGFRLREQEVNAFILFGLPGESIADILNTAFYAQEKVGGLVPMLFTPVPGSKIYEEHAEYLHGKKGFDLHHLNGKLYPFLELNNELSGIDLKDYEDLEMLMWRFNYGRARGSSMDLNGKNRVYVAVRNIQCKIEAQNGDFRIGEYTT